MRKRSALQINLDERVILTLITSCIVAVSIMLWSFSSSKNKPCLSGNIFIKWSSSYTGEFIRFTAEAKNIVIENAVWNFGDKHIQMGTTVYHTYATSGRYKIQLAINGTCTKDISIDIIPKKNKSENIRSDSIQQSISPEFSGPHTANVGKQVAFKDSTTNAIKWEWQFGETGLVDAIVQNPVYTFRSKGVKNVTLKINGKMEGSMKVSVTEAKKRPTGKKKCRGCPKTPPLNVQLK